MGEVLHGSATATATVRRAIQARQKIIRAAAKRYDIRPTTVPMAPHTTPAPAIMITGRSSASSPSTQQGDDRTSAGAATEGSRTKPKNWRNFFRREQQARLATATCNRCEVRRQIMDAASAMARNRYEVRTLLDLTI